MIPIHFICAVCARPNPSLSGVIDCYETDLYMLRTIPKMDRKHLWISEDATLEPVNYRGSINSNRKEEKEHDTIQ